MRMSTEEKKGRAWWAVPVILVLYVLGFGPAFAIAAQIGHDAVDNAVRTFYRPLAYAAERSPAIMEWLWWYMELWLP